MPVSARYPSGDPKRGAPTDSILAVTVRLPRVNFLRLGDRTTFALPQPGPKGPRVLTVLADPMRPPVEPERVEIMVVLFAYPLLDRRAHAALVEAWADILPAFGKWFELVAADGPDDPVIDEAERHLKDNGFEKVRSTRLALGRMGSALYLVSGRATGPDDEEE